mgnify:FL=1
MNFFKKLFRKAERKERLNVYIVKNLYPAVKAYVECETEHGILLPQDFKRDPAAWLNVLRDIEYSFYETLQEYSGEGISCLMNTEDMEKRNKRIQKGFELFGKYLMELN